MIWNYTKVFKRNYLYVSIKLSQRNLNTVLLQTVALKISGAREGKAADQSWGMLTIPYSNLENTAESGLDKLRLKHTYTDHVGASSSFLPTTTGKGPEPTEAFPQTHVPGITTYKTKHTIYRIFKRLAYKEKFERNYYLNIYVIIRTNLPCYITGFTD